MQRATNYPEELRRDFAIRTKGGRSDIRGGGFEEEDEIHPQIWQSLDNLEIAIAATWQDFVELSACVASGKSLMRSFGRLIARINRATSLEVPPGGSWQTDLPTLVQKVTETRRLLSSTIEYLDTAKKMLECHNAWKTMEDAIEDAQEAARIDDLTEADFSYCWLMAGTMTFGRLIKGKKSVSHPEDVTMLREAEEALERLHSWRLALQRAQQFQGRRARRSRRSSPHAHPAIMAQSEGDQRRGVSKARVQSRPEARASCARRMHNDKDEVSENEGSGEARGAVQDSAEESYEPRPKFDAPARESCSRSAKTAAKVAPEARETAAAASGYKWRRMATPAGFQEQAGAVPEGIIKWLRESVFGGQRAPR
jgi:hypothetical protein